MFLQAIFYFLILIISALISLALAAYTWQHRQTVGAKPFSILMFVLFEWAMTYFFQITSTDLATKTFWSKLAFLGVVSTPAVWLIFALEYTGRNNWTTPLRTLLLFIVPALTVIVIYTNDAHNWFWVSDKLIQEGGLMLRKSENGFWFWIHSSYSYALILIGTVLVVRALLSWPKQYRGQMIWILLAVFTPWFANALSIFNIIPFVIDITPFAFTVTGIGMAFALFRHRLLDLAPIAREVVIEGMQDGMIVLDVNNRIVDMNPAAQNILNLSENKQPFGEQIEIVFPNWSQLIEQNKKAIDLKNEIILGKGENRRWIELSISPLHNKTDNLVGRLVFIRDITQRIKAEQQVRQLSRAVESSPTSIVITGIDGNIQYVNPKFTQLTGYTLEEAMGKNPSILKTEFTPAETYKGLWEALSAGKEWSGEFCNRKKNGELYWEIASISPIENADGKITHYVAVKEDITERKHTESLLQESEERFRQIVENASDYIYRTDIEGHFTYANPAALHVMGFTEEQEVIGKHFLDLTAPEARHRMKRTYQRQFISKIENTYSEFPAITKDGLELWFGQNVQLLMEDDQVAGFQVLARDITAIKHAQEALQIAYDQALEASRAKSQLLSNVSHELRTPLGGILGYAELLRTGAFGELVEEQKKASEEILQSVHYLTSMVNELLDSAQIQTNTITLQERMFSPATLAQQTVSSTEILAHKKGLQLITSIDPNLPKELWADDRRLRQILINLIGNAIKFTKEGQVQVSLGYPDSEHWYMQVTDTGMGIPQEAQTSIFEPFKQADNAITCDNRGIGLGLSITKQLVELMGGRIMLISRLGEGSTFSVLLPIVLPPADRSSKS